MIQLTAFVLALCSLIPSSQGFFFDSKRVAVEHPSDVLIEARVLHDPSYPPRLHNYIKRQLAAGNLDQLQMEFSFDVEARAARYEKEMQAALYPDQEESAASEEVTDEERRRLISNSPTLAPSVYSLPPTPAGSSVRATALSNEDDTFIAVDFEQVISHRDANKYCREQFGNGNTWSQATFNSTHPYGGPQQGASVLGGVDPNNPNVPYDASVLADWDGVINEMQALCQAANNGPCWIGLFWRWRTQLWKWRGHGSTLDIPTGGEFWAPNEPKSTFLQQNQPDLYCAILDPTQSYEVVSVDCIPTPTNAVKVGICYNLFYKV